MARPLLVLGDGRPSPAEAPRAGAEDAFAKVATGDVNALATLLRFFWNPLTRYASRLLNDIDTADDVVQDVFVRVWARRGEWKAGSVRALLFSLTRNAALDELRRRGSRAKLALVTMRQARRFPQTPAELLERDETSAFVSRAIQELPPRRREVFDLVHLRGLSYHDVAEIMGTSVKTVENQMTAALRQLRNALQPLVRPSNLITRGSLTEASVRPADTVSHATPWIRQ